MKAASGLATSMSRADSCGGVTVAPARYSSKRAPSAGSAAASSARKSASSAASRAGSYRSPYQKPSMPSAKSRARSRGALPAPLANEKLLSFRASDSYVTELLVVNQRDVFRLLAIATRRAGRIVRALELPELHGQRVEHQLAPAERLADSQQDLDRLDRLQRSDHAAQHAKHAGLLAGGRHVGRRRLRVEAAVAG